MKKMLVAVGAFALTSSFAWASGSPAAYCTAVKEGITVDFQLSRTDEDLSDVSTKDFDNDTYAILVPDDTPAPGEEASDSINLTRKNKSGKEENIGSIHAPAGTQGFSSSTQLGKKKYVNVFVADASDYQNKTGITIHILASNRDDLSQSKMKGQMTLVAPKSDSLKDGINLQNVAVTCDVGWE